METKSKAGAQGPKEPLSRKPHAPYPPEFRAEAVRLVRAADTSMRRVAKDLGVHEETLRL
jgi:transposase-like protein